MEDSRYQILRLSIKLHLLRPRGFGAKMENQVSGTDERVWKQKTSIWLSARLRQFDGEKKVFLYMKRLEQVDIQMKDNET